MNTKFPDVRDELLENYFKEKNIKRGALIDFFKPSDFC